MQQSFVSFSHIFFFIRDTYSIRKKDMIFSGSQTYIFEQVEVVLGGFDHKGKGKYMLKMRYLPHPFLSYMC